MALALGGVLAPVVTPFRDSHVDAAGLASNLERYATTALTGIVVLGSTGEAPLLDDAESDLVVAAARRAVGRGQLLVAGTGRESTAATVAATRRAAEAGADAALVRTPSYFRPSMTADALLRHYETVADASPIPVVLYSVAVFTGVGLPLEAVVRLAAHENVAGIKDSTSDVEALGRLVHAAPQRLAVLAGSATAFYASLCLGVAGAVLGPAGVIPDLCTRLFELVARGAHAEALALQCRIDPLSRLLGGALSVSGIKAALDIAGYVGGAPRLPLLPAPPAEAAVIRRYLQDLLTLV